MNEWSRRVKFWTRWIMTLIWGMVWKIKRFKSTEELVARHFERWSKSDHQNRQGFLVAVNSLEGKAANIIETGTSDYGTDSSRLFDSYVRNFGGNFYTVDISPYPARRLRLVKSRRSHFFVMDSVQFLNRFSEITSERSADLIYLDSWDVDWSNPRPSAEHGKRELVAIRPLLSAGTVIVIDDTPAQIDWVPISNKDIALKFKNEFGVLPGKGAFYNQALAGINYKVLYHDYNLVLIVQ